MLMYSFCEALVYIERYAKDNFTECSWMLFTCVAYIKEVNSTVNWVSYMVLYYLTLT